MSSEAALALIAAIAAILAPAIAAIITSIFQYKTRKMELSRIPLLEAITALNSAYQSFCKENSDFYLNSVIQNALSVSVLSRKRTSKRELRIFVALISAERTNTQRTDQAFNRCLDLLFREG